MIAEPYSSAIAPATSTFGQFKTADSAVKLAEAKLREIERDLQAARAERARAVELQDQDAALRHVDGENAVPIKPARAKRIQTLNEKIPALTAAIPIQKARIADREREAASALEPFTGAILQGVSAIQEPAAERIRATLADLIEPLRDLLAADLIRVGTIGERFSIPAGTPAPFSGSVVVRKLLGGIPARLLPPELTLNRVEAQANGIATAAIRSIKESR